MEEELRHVKSATEAGKQELEAVTLQRDQLQSQGLCPGADRCSVGQRSALYAAMDILILRLIRHVESGLHPCTLPLHAVAEQAQSMAKQLQEVAEQYDSLVAMHATLTEEHQVLLARQVSSDAQAAAAETQHQQLEALQAAEATAQSAQLELSELHTNHESLREKHASLVAAYKDLREEYAALSTTHSELQEQVAQERAKMRAKSPDLEMANIMEGLRFLQVGG